MKIVLIEDDLNINLIISNLLEEYDIISTTTGEEGIKYIDNTIDLVIVDLMLPAMSGQDVIKAIRTTNNNVKIFVITALDIEDVQIKCLDLGIDDYITKPIALKVLKKKVELIDSTHKTLLINKEAMEVKYNGITYVLTKREFEILEYLYQNSNNYVTREQIALHVWGYDFEGEYKNINTHIKNIRNKISGINIKTSRNIGYKYVQ